jgi:hypothetical protein
MSEEGQTQSEDDELQSLLSELTADSTLSDNIIPEAVSENIPNVAVPIIPDPEFSEPATDLEQTEPPNLLIESTTSSSDLKEIVEKFDHDYGEVQANLKKDRVRIDTVIDILLQRVRTNSDAETDTMSLVKALNVLSDTNGHSIKLLDSRSKLLSATKIAINANQTNVNIGGGVDDWAQILNQPPEADE